MRDHAYDEIPYRAPEMPHRYGPSVHVLAEPLALTQLARLCAKGTNQPDINRLVGELYRDLLRVVVNAEFPRRAAATPTRMIDHTPHGVFHGETIDPEVRVITVNIARAGTLPSQITYDFLNTLLDPRLVRQDHFVMARVMGATGGSICTALDAYKTQVVGSPRKVIAAHLIVTPEYVKRVTAQHPGTLIYALRLDRGLSPPEVVDTAPVT